MKLPVRIAVPIGLALFLALLIGGFFLWQIRLSVSTIESSFHVNSAPSGMLQALMPKGSPSENAITGNQSQALMLLRQGEIFEMKGLWKQAQEKYEESVGNGGGIPALRKLTAMQLQRREYDAAKQSIGKLKEDTDDDRSIMLLEGLLALRSGDKKSAQSIFSRNEKAPESIYGLALLDITEGRYSEAEGKLRSIAQNIESAVRNYALTVLQAFDEFALFPNGQTVHLQTLLARSLAQVNECETAINLLQTVTTEKSQYRDAWIVKGYCEFSTERLAEALASLEQAYSLDPEKPEIQYFLARTHAALGDPQNAVTFLQYALLNGFSPERDARELLANYAKELGNIDLALEQLRILAEAPEGTISDYDRAISLAIGSETLALEGLELGKNALKRWPDDPTALALAADGALAAGVPAEAKKYIDSALRIDPKNPRALEVEKKMKARE